MDEQDEDLRATTDDMSNAVKNRRALSRQVQGNHQRKNLEKIHHNNIPNNIPRNVSSNRNSSNTENNNGNFNMPWKGDTKKPLDFMAKNPHYDIKINGVLNYFTGGKAAILVASIGGIFIFLLIVISIIFLSKNSDGLNYASGSKYENEEYEKFYNTIDEVYSDYLNKYGVLIDKNLIVATLTALQDNSLYFNDGSLYGSVGIDDEGYDEDGNVITIEKSVTDMTNKVEILARYQIKTVTVCDYDYSTPRAIARNDDGGDLTNFWQSALQKEKNYQCSLVRDSGSNPLDPDPIYYELSTGIGDINDDSSGSVYYWNLIDEGFIEEYYKEFFDKIKDEEVRKTQLARIVDYIYLYKESLDNVSAHFNGSGVVVDLDVNDSLSCDVVTVLPDKNGNYGGQYALEDYVAGVIQDEFSPNYAANVLGGLNEGTRPIVKEALKGFAIAVRTYTINRTRGCTKPIANSSNAQNFKPTTNSFIREIVLETEGIVLTNNGKVFSAQYDSFMGKDNCDSSRGVCSWDYVMNPSKETHSVVVPSAWRRYLAGGHGRGMSQWATIDLAQKGMNYQEIAKYFYAPGVELQLIRK